MKLEGITAVVTGSTGGLGSAIALAVADAGCDCVCHYHANKARADRLVEQIRATGRSAIALPADLTRPDEIASLMEQARSLGPVRVLINSAAVFAREPIETVAFDAAQKTLAINLIAPMLAARGFAQIIREEVADAPPPAGKIINLVDVGGIRPWAGYTVYCASKAGLVSVTKSLAKELLPAITVNAVAPGLVSWPKHFSDDEKARQLKQVPMKRMAEPAEITEAVIFLLKNDYVTGQILSIDGGRSI
ncbi:MAG: SDR family oxidoreductase [Phycisphaerae bacterium]|nr:SDR family oxidoreductase [Phycisphaerae bacterium]